MYVCVVVNMSLLTHEWEGRVDLNLKLFAFELAAKFSRQRGKSRSTTFVQRVKRNFETAHNGVFPSNAIFAGQLKHNQLYKEEKSAKCLCVYVHLYMNACIDMFQYT
jgi:hypothetical protein